MAFQYDYAIVSKISKSFIEYKANMDSNRSGIFSFEEAVAERTNFVEVLRNIGVSVLELAVDDRHPECIKIDDTAVIINGTALMCNPAGSHRQGEVCLCF